MDILLSSVEDVKKMKLTKFDDAAQYYQRVENYLLQHEAANCLILGMSKGLVGGEANTANQPYMVVVEHNQSIVATAIQTPPRNLILAKPSNSEAIELIAQELASNPQSLPGVIAPKAEAKIFINIWHNLTTQSHQLDVAMRVHQLSQMQLIAHATGKIRLAVESDRHLLTDWIQAFVIEALGDNEPKSDSQLWFDRNLKKQSLYVWQDRETVSMATYGGTTPNGIRVNGVYTPPEHRGKGYATSCVAGMSQKLLKQYKHCFLFTNLANSTSNYIYRKIGYLPMDDISNYKFY
jgi:predicted GNAT family acetyltransferase